MEALLTMIAPWLASAASLLVTNQFNLIWCGGTIVYFLFWMVALLWRSVPLRRSLGRVIKPLADIDGPVAFARAYESYTKQVASEKSLRHAWREFTESLVTPREGENPKIRNTHEPSSYFNDATVVQPVVHNRFLDTVPSHLVGLGILGTFLGLAAGVGLAAGKLDASDPKEVQAALRTLLNGASLAFMTSIVGLGSSLLFLWCERVLIGSVHRRLSDWMTKLEACVELVTAEEIALQQLEQQRRQTTQLETFNTELLFNLEKALDEKVAQRLVPQLEKVVDAIDSLRADRADTNVTAMQRLVEEFSQKLTQSTGREMEAIGTTLRDVGDRLQIVMSAMQESQDRTRELVDQAVVGARESLASGSAAVAENLRGITAEVARALSQASNDLTSQMASAGTQLQRSGETTAGAIAGSLSSFTESVARLERATTTQGELAIRVMELTSGLRGAGDVLVQAHKGFTESLNPVRDMTRSLDGAGARVAGALEATQKLVEEVTATGRSLREENEKVAGIWRDYQERFQGVDASLAKVFERLDEGLQRYQVQVRDYLKEVDQQVGKAIQTLGAAIAELQETMEDRSDRPQERR